MKDRNGQDNQGGTEMRERVYIPRKKETKIVSELFSETRLFHASRNYVACHWQHHIKITPKYLHSITIDIFWSMDSHLPLIILFTIKTSHFFFLLLLLSYTKCLDNVEENPYKWMMFRLFSGYLLYPKQLVRLIHFHCPVLMLLHLTTKSLDLLPELVQWQYAASVLRWVEFLVHQQEYHSPDKQCNN